jgi:hypothetical protein
MTSGTKVITGLTDTSQLVRGMQITGTSVGAASVIATIDSATQVTGTVNSTGSTTNAVTFKLVASTLYDVFAVPTSSSAYRIQYGPAWTSSAAGSSSRAVAVTQANAVTNTNGVLYNDAVIASGDSNSIAANGGRWLGTIMSTATAGQTEDSSANRLVFNGAPWNRVPRTVLTCPGYVDNNAQTNYTSTSTTFTAATFNGASGVVSFVSDGGYPSVPISADAQCVNSGANGTYVGIGFNSSTTPQAAAAQVGTTAAHINARSDQLPAVGYNTITLLIRVSAGTGTYSSDDSRGGGSADPRLTQLNGSVWQ